MMIHNRGVLFLVFCTFRIINVCFIQTQFDPDEYWQQLEPAYCHVFKEPGKSCPGLTWEWKRRPRDTHVNSLSEFIESGMNGPVRSYSSILPTLVFYYVIKCLGLDTPWVVARGPVFLNAILIAVPTDWSVWYLSKWMESASKYQDFSIGRWCVYCCLSSWFLAYALVRTYSNSLETALLMLSLCLVGPDLLDKDMSQHPYRIGRACLAFFLGGLSCSIRFTSLAAFVPMGLILSFRAQPKTFRSVLIYIICICALFGLLGMASTLALDYHMYGFPAFPLLGNIHFNVILGTRVKHVRLPGFLLAFRLTT